MTLSELSVRRPVLMTMAYVLISVICIVFLPRLDLALYPSVDYPVISVNISCNDAGPEEIELQVTKVMEDALDSLSNLEEMTSQSREGRSSVTLEFKYGTDLDDAYNDVNAIASRMSRFLPDWAESPTIIRYDSMGSGSILRLILTGDRTKDELQYIAENTVQPLIERIDGVAQVNVYGGAPIEFEVQVDPNRLEAYGLSLTSIANAIEARNVQSTGGEITQRGKDFQITTDARYMTLRDISETIIGYAADGNPILVQDVAEVAEETASGGRLNYLNGNEVVTISISNDSESNETTVASDVMAELDNIRAELPPGLDLVIQRDNTELIRNTMSEVASSAVQGVILAAVIIFVFLRNIKSTIIISLSMPICILITLMLMSLTGMSVNAMSMSGLILGIGMTVDASIIILENTYSFRERNERSAIAAILGSENMFTAIVASTLTTICVFFSIQHKPIWHTIAAIRNTICKSTVANGNLFPVVRHAWPRNIHPRRNKVSMSSILIRLSNSTKIRFSYPAIAPTRRYNSLSDHTISLINVHSHPHRDCNKPTLRSNKLLSLATLSLSTA